MSIKITIPNTSSDVLTFGSANTPTAAQIAGIDSGSSNGQLALYTTASGTSTERVRVDASGNVGIGTSSPVYQTQIYGTGQTTAALTDAGNKGGSLFLNTPTVSAGDGGALLIGAGSTGSKPFAAIKGLLADGANNTTGNLAFSTRNATADTALTERMRIDSSGNLLVGTTTYNGSSNTPGVGVNPVGQIAIERDAGAAAVLNRYTSNGNIVIFRRSGTTVGSIDVTTTATSYVTSSDYRLKNTIAPMTGALDKVALLKPCTYKWNVDGSDGQGFIAHELAAVVPQCVTGEKDAVDVEGNPEYQGIDTSFLVATLTAAIQEQQALITQLQADVAALKGA